MGRKPECERSGMLSDGCGVFRYGLGTEITVSDYCGRHYVSVAYHRACLFCRPLCPDKTDGSKISAMRHPV